MINAEALVCGCIVPANLQCNFLGSRKHRGISQKADLIKDNPIFLFANLYLNDKLELPVEMAQDPHGKTAIVTGAGSGINLEFARLLLEAGANVVFADLRLRPEAEEVVKQYQNTPKAVFHKTDVTSWSNLSSTFEATRTQFGSIDIVCPGAGVFEPKFSSFWYPPGSAETKDSPTGDHYASLDINLVHPIRVTQMAISHFLSASPPASTSNPKSIVHISSIAGQTASFLFPLYHASKWGVAGFVRSLGTMEKLHGIRVTGVMPGVVKTPLFLDNPDKLQIVRQTGENMDVWVTPQEVAQVMLSLVKDNEVSTVPGSSSSEMIPLQGGALVEVTAGRLRLVPQFNNPGPDGAGSTVQDATKLGKEAIDLMKPGWGQIE